MHTRNLNTIIWIAMMAAILIVASPAAADDEPTASGQEVQSQLSAQTSASPSVEKPKPQRPQSSAYKKWKRHLPFWPRKGWMLLELSVYIALGIFLAQVLEVAGIVKYLAVLAWPITRLGKLNKETAPAFLMAFQSGAIANSMLVSSRSEDSIDAHQLYTSVFVVSCLSLFAHLPTYIVPIGSVLGPKATIALFAVRFAAIALEIVAILVVSRCVVGPWLRRKNKTMGPDSMAVTQEQLAAAEAARRKGE